MMTDSALIFHIQKSIYDDHTRFMVSWWGIYSYFNIGKIQTRDVVLMNYISGSSG